MIDVVKSAGALHYLDGLGAPFMFLEERMVRLPEGMPLLVQNILPKLVFVLEGSMRCRFDSAQLTELVPGSVLINFDRRSHEYHPLEKKRGSQLRVLRLTLPWNFRSLSGEIENGAEPLGRFLGARIPARGVIEMPLNATWGNLLKELRQMLHSRAVDRRYRVTALAQLATLELVRWQNALSVSAEEDNPGRLREKVESFLEENLHRQFSLDEVAMAIDRSAEHIARIFRREKGLTVFEELKRLRIERARYLLLCTELSVTKIAEQTGFVTLAHFSRVFREMAGRSPRDFRASAEPHTAS